MRLFKQQESEFWYMDYIDPATGRRRRESLRVTDRRTAEKILAQRRIETAEEKHLGIRTVEPLTFEEMAEKYFELTGPLKKQSSYIRERYSYQNLCLFFSGKLISEIKSDEIDKYRTERLTQVKPATVNREVGLLHSIFGKAVEWGLLGFSPLSATRPLKEDNIRTRVLSIRVRIRKLFSMIWQKNGQYIH